MATPQKQDFRIKANGTWVKTLVFSANDVPLNLTGYTFEMEVKSKQGAASTKYFTLSTGSGITVVDVNTGTITIEIPPKPDITKPTVYFYDIIAIVDSKPYVWLYGTLTFEPGTSYIDS